MRGPTLASEYRSVAYVGIHAIIVSNAQSASFANFSSEQNTRFHRRGNADCFVNPPEVVVHECFSNINVLIVEYTVSVISCFTFELT